MATVKRTKEEITNKGTVDHEKLRAVNGSDIEQWAQYNDIDMSDASIATTRFVPRLTASGAGAAIRRSV